MVKVPQIEAYLHRCKPNRGTELSTAELDREVQHHLQCTISDSTMRSYQSGVNAFRWKIICKTKRDTCYTPSSFYPNLSHIYP